MSVLHKREMDSLRTTKRTGWWVLSLVIVGVGGLAVVGCTTAPRDVASMEEDSEQAAATAHPAAAATPEVLAGDQANPDVTGHEGTRLASLERAQPTMNAASPAPAELHWREDYEAALAESARLGRPVLLRFTAAWCGPCQAMDRAVFSQEDVQQALATRVVPVMLDIDEEAAGNVAWEYGVRSVPTMILVDARGEELSRGGFMSRDQLLEFLRG